MFIDHSLENNNNPSQVASRLSAGRDILKNGMDAKATALLKTRKVLPMLTINSGSKKQGKNHRLEQSASRKSIFVAQSPTVVTSHGLDSIQGLKSHSSGKVHPGRWMITLAA